MTNIICIIALCQVTNRHADGASLNGRVETLQLLLDLGAALSEATVEDGTAVDLIGDCNYFMIKYLMETHRY